MAAFRFHHRIISIDIDRLLFHQEGSYGLEGYTEVDVLSVADTALDTSRVVGTCIDATLVVIEHIVLLASAQSHVVEPFAISKSLHGIDAEHRMAKCCMKFTEGRLSQSHRASLDDTRDDTANGIALSLHLLDESGHFFGFRWVRATHIIGLDQVEIVFLIVFFQFDLAYL